MALTKAKSECIRKCSAELGLYVPTKFASVKSVCKPVGEIVTGRGWGVRGIEVVC